MELSKSSRESESAAADSTNGEEQPLLSENHNSTQSSSGSHALQGQNLPYASDKIRPGNKDPAREEVGEKTDCRPLSVREVGVITSHASKNVAGR